MQLALWFRCYWKLSAVDVQRQKCLRRYICRKPLGFSCFLPVPECARKSTTVDPFTFLLCLYFPPQLQQAPAPVPWCFCSLCSCFGKEAQWDLSALGTGRWRLRGCWKEAEGGFCQEGVFATFDANHFGRVNADTEIRERAFHVNSDEKKGITRAT